LPEQIAKEIDNLRMVAENQTSSPGVPRSNTVNSRMIGVMRMRRWRLAFITPETPRLDLVPTEILLRPSNLELQPQLQRDHAWRAITAQTDAE
jgi:hypothetical protein